MRSLCDQKTTNKKTNKLTMAERSQRSWKGFIEVTKRSPIGRRTKFVADRSTTVRRSVSPRKGRVSSQCGSDLSVTDRRLGGDRSALYRRLVGNQLQSGFQACANHSAMGLQTSPTCLRMTASSRNKCSMSPDRLLKMVRKRSWKRDLLAIQGLNQYCLRLLLVNRLYAIIATIAAF